MIKQKVGIIVDGTVASKLLYDLIKFSLASENYTISTLIVNDAQRNTGSIVSKAYHYILKRGFSNFFKVLASKFFVNLRGLLLLNEIASFQTFLMSTISVNLIWMWSTLRQLYQKAVWFIDTMKAS